MAIIKRLKPYKVQLRKHSELYEAVTRSSQEKNEKIKLTSGRKSYASRLPAGCVHQKY